MENVSEETHSNKNSLASAVKRVLDLLSVCPAPHNEDVQAKKKHT